MPRRAGRSSSSNPRPASAALRPHRGRKVRYAVVGLGYISQVAVLPAFAHAGRNSELAALVSDDPAKLKKLGRRYRVKDLFSYEQFDECLEEVDAVYVALPNSLHRPYTERAAAAGVHVLCEKPMAVTDDDCRAMIQACRDNQVKLMIAYRLHFEAANLAAVEAVRSGKLGDPRVFDSVFTMQVEDGNIRLRRETGGGTLYDIGIYCINAARYLFRAEPEEVVGWHAAGKDPRFAECPEMTSASLRFPGERLATFSVSFGGGDVSSYEVVGTKGSLRLDPAYEIAGDLTHHLALGNKKRTKVYPARDQFAPELLYFSDCIQKDVEPEPSGEEGLADVRILRAIDRSAAERRPVKLAPFSRAQRPSPAQAIHRPVRRPPEMVNAQKPSAS
jgi:predicted dehydrogenase